MKYLSLTKQLLKERQKNERLSTELSKNTADIDYIAMMCDIELELPLNDNITMGEDGINGTQSEI